MLLNKFCEDCENEIASEVKRKQDLQEKMVQLYFVVTGETKSVSEVVEFFSHATECEMIEFKKKAKESAISK